MKASTQTWSRRMAVMEPPEMRPTVGIPPWPMSCWASFALAAPPTQLNTDATGTSTVPVT